MNRCLEDRRAGETGRSSVSGALARHSRAWQPLGWMGPEVHPAPPCVPEQGLCYLSSQPLKLWKPFASHTHSLPQLPSRWRRGQHPSDDRQHCFPRAPYLTQKPWNKFICPTSFPVIQVWSDENVLIWINIVGDTAVMWPWHGRWL